MSNIVNPIKLGVPTVAFTWPKGATLGLAIESRPEGGWKCSVMCNGQVTELPTVFATNSEAEWAGEKYIEEHRAK
jgi:hypothetical protein